MSYQRGVIETVIGTGEAGYAGDGGPAGAALLREPFMCSFDSAGNIYLAEARNHSVRRIDRDTGVITTRSVQRLAVDGQGSHPAYPILLRISGARPMGFARN